MSDPRYVRDVGGIRYVFVRKLGNGRFGEVDEYIASSEVGEETPDSPFAVGERVAIKVVDTTLTGNEYMEPLVLKLLSGKHPAFLSLKSVSEDKERSETSIVMDVAEGIDLFERLTRPESIALNQKKFIIRQIVEAMVTAAELSVVHRDLKPENIHITEDNRIKILDWGMSLVCGDFNLSGGSSHYAAPEILKAPSSVGPWNDVWSIGAIVYSILTKRMAFTGSTIPRLFDKIRSFTIDYDARGLDDDSRRFLQRIFVPWQQRATCKELLSDSWLKE